MARSQGEQAAIAAWDAKGAWDDRRGALRMHIPARLRPYLEDLVRTGLHGTTVESAALGLIQDGINASVVKGAIVAREGGRVVIADTRYHEGKRLL